MLHCIIILWIWLKIQAASTLLSCSLVMNDSDGDMVNALPSCGSSGFSFNFNQIYSGTPKRIALQDFEALDALQADYEATKAQQTQQAVACNRQQTAAAPDAAAQQRLQPHAFAGSAQRPPFGALATEAAMACTAQNAPSDTAVTAGGQTHAAQTKQSLGNAGRSFVVSTELRRGGVASLAHRDAPGSGGIASAAAASLQLLLAANAGRDENSVQLQRPADGSLKHSGNLGMAQVMAPSAECEHAVLWPCDEDVALDAGEAAAPQGAEEDEEEINCGGPTLIDVDTTTGGIQLHRCAAVNT